MNISRKEIRDAAKVARTGKTAYINGESLTVVEVGTTGKYVYTYMDHPGFTSVAKLVEFIQAAPEDVAAEGPTTPPTKPESAVAGIKVTAEDVFGPKLDGAKSIDAVIVDDATDCSDVNADRDEERLKLRHEFVDSVNASVTNHPPPIDGKNFTDQKSFRRLRSHRRKLRRSGVNKGLSVIG